MPLVAEPRFASRNGPCGSNSRTFGSPRRNTDSRASDDSNGALSAGIASASSVPQACADGARRGNPRVIERHFFALRRDCVIAERGRIEVRVNKVWGGYQHGEYTWTLPFRRQPRFTRQRRLPMRPIQGKVMAPWRRTRLAPAGIGRRSRPSGGGPSSTRRSHPTARPRCWSNPQGTSSRTETPR